MTADRSPVIERASAADMMALAAATTPAAGQVGAVLISAPGHTVGLAAARATLDERACGVPRLRQRLRPTPPGCGRPIWVDDPAFTIAAHVDAVPCPPPGDRAAVLAVAADLLAEELPADRSPWAATLVTDLADGGTAIVVRFHHVLADGLGGLAVLAHLVDGAPPRPPRTFPRPPPRPATLCAGALRARLRALTRPRRGLRLVGDALAELGGRPPSAPRTSLNRPVGPRRSLAVARADLATIHAAAHARGASVNDAVLAAVSGALGRFLAERGEAADRLVAAIPVAARTAAEASGLGNEIGVLPVALPTGGTTGGRIGAVAAVTRARKAQARGASMVLLAPVFRLLAATGRYHWFVERQRMVNTFVTNLRGPAEPVRLLGLPVAELVALNSTSGNVQVAFGALSYAGTLTVTIVADARLAADLPGLAAHLQRELDAVAAAGAGRPPTTPMNRR